MPRTATRLSKLSVGYNGSSSTLGESDYDLSAFGSHVSQLQASSAATIHNLSIGGDATRISGLVYSTWSVDPGSLAGNVTSLLSRAVTGVGAGDVIVLHAGSSLSVNFNLKAYCESAGSVTYELGNVGGATQDLSVITVRMLAFTAST